MNVYYTVAVSSSSTFNLTAMDAITGTVQAGSTLTAGVLTPTGASATYQWESSSTVNGTYSVISSGSNAYTLTASDIGKFFKVVATGTGSYAGTMTSASVGPVTSISMTSIGTPTGSLKLGLTLMAGTVLPSGATFTYQWLRCLTYNGTYGTITGATASTYTIATGDYGYYFEVRTIGIGSYSGMVTSAYLGPAAAGTLTAIAAPTGTTAVGSVLTAGALTPATASATYQMMRCATSGGTYINISGATSSTYTPTSSDATYYIEVKVAGSGNYSGTVTSIYVGIITTPVTAIAATTGTLTYNQTLTAGARTPSVATVSYKWMRSTTSGGTYTAITGATSSTYVLAAADVGCYIEVSVTGTGNYSNTVTSAVRGPIAAISVTAAGTISGTKKVSNTLSVGTTTPSAATVTYQWMRCATSGGTYSVISGATSSTYTLTGSDYNKYIELVVTGYGGYTGSVTSSATSVISSVAISSIGAITGTAKSGNTLTAGSTVPSGASVTYQWTRCTTSVGTYTSISGATSSTYVLTSSDVGRYIKLTVTAVASSGYTGTATSAAFGPITS